MLKIRRGFNKIAGRFNAINPFSRERPEDHPSRSVEELERELHELEHLAQKNQARFLKTSAELEDYKKRAEGENAELLKYGN
jgi:molecular chaperone GrpE (heat shock protein)